MGKYDKERTILKEKFTQYGISQECSACGVDNWNILKIDLGKIMVWKYISYIPLKVICLNYGRIQEYDAIHLGIRS
jgi:hypothetical protein